LPPDKKASLNWDKTIGGGGGHADDDPLEKFLIVKSFVAGE
jgi:hypothetical protein